MLNKSFYIPNPTPEVIKTIVNELKYNPLWRAAQCFPGIVFEAKLCNKPFDAIFKALLIEANKNFVSIVF